MTAAYSALDQDAPDGTTGTATTYSASDLSNVRALRDAAVCGFVPNFAYSIVAGTGSIWSPQYRQWAQVGGNIRFRLVAIAYGGSLGDLPTQVKWQWSDDGGASWADMDSTASILTWDTTAGKAVTLTGVDRNGGLWSVALEAMVRGYHAAAVFYVHATSGGGDADHGLGNAAHASLSAMAIIGASTFNGTSIGLSFAPVIDAQRIRETIANGGSPTVLAAGGTYSMDVSVAGYFKVQPNATQSATATIAAPLNPPASNKTQTITIEIINGKRDVNGRITWDAAFHWIGGSANKPGDDALQLAGSDIFYATWNGASWDIVYGGKRG